MREICHLAADAAVAEMPFLFMPRIDAD